MRPEASRYNPPPIPKAWARLGGGSTKGRQSGTARLRVRDESRTLPLLCQMALFARYPHPDPSLPT